MSSSSKLLCFCSIKINSPSWFNTLQPPCIASIYLFEGAFMVWFWILTWHLATYVSNLSGVLFSILRGSLTPSQMFLYHLKQTHKDLPLCSKATMPQKIWLARSVKTIQNQSFHLLSFCWTPCITMYLRTLWAASQRGGFISSVLSNLDLVFVWNFFL